jgi:hypothetical protein
MKSPLGPSLYPSIITSIWALISLIVILSSLYLTDGRLVYTLDDPYIALKLANVVLGGGYGINASEHCSPSSSILYPLMLVVTQRLGLGSAGPLVLDAIAAGSSVYLGSLFIERYVLGGAVTRKTALFAYPLGVLMIFAFSAVALPMTGLEHSWHILLIVVILFEFARMVSTGAKHSEPRRRHRAHAADPLRRRRFIVRRHRGVGLCRPLEGRSDCRGARRPRIWRLCRRNGAVRPTHPAEFGDLKIGRCGECRRHVGGIRRRESHPS